MRQKPHILPLFARVQGALRPQMSIMSENASTDHSQTYRIGAVARLTGISADRLRAWERRYGVVETNAPSPWDASTPATTSSG